MAVLAVVLAAVLLGSSTAAPPMSLDAKAVDALAKRFFAERPATRFVARDERAFQALVAEASRSVQLSEDSLAPVVDRLLAAGKKSVVPFPKETFETPYGTASWLRRPPKAKPPKSKELGLIIGLHGGGEGAGDAAEATRFARKDCLGVYPQGIRLVHDTWNTTYGERFLLTLIERAKLQDGVDPDRVYVTGFSMGGTGSWFLAGRHPDLLAAAAPGPGVFMASPKSQVKTKQEVVALQHGLLPNVRNLPVRFYVGLEDANTMAGTYLFAWDRIAELKAADPGGYGKIEFRSFEGMAHEFPPGEPDASLEWLGTHVRDPWPDVLVWEYASEPFPVAEEEDPLGRVVKKQFHWLWCDDPQDRMRVKAQRKGNEFDLTIEKADPRSFRVLLRSDWIDPAQEIVVKVGGKESYRGRPRPDVEVLLMTFDQHLDRKLTFDRAARLRG